MRWSAGSIEAKVKEIVASVLDHRPEHVAPDTTANHDNDSVGNIEIIMLCEDAFGITIPHEGTEHFATVGQIVAYVERRLDFTDER